VLPLLIIRADASPQMGTGHVMRGLALSAAWQAAGGRVTFVTYCTAATLRQRIESNGARLIALDELQQSPEQVLGTLRDVVEVTRDVAPAKPWVALDGYHFPAVCQRAIRRLGCRLLMIDDLAQHSTYHADLVLNQNLGAEQYTYRCAGKTPLLLGSQYVLLRPEFQSWQGWPRTTPPLATKILVTLGGADPRNTTSLVIEALSQLDVPGLKARVIVGAANVHAAEIQRRAAKMGNWVELLTSAPDMPSLMAGADLAVAAAGLTCWELAFMQLPALLLVIADNQEPLAAQAAQAGMAHSLGWARQQTAVSLDTAIRGLCPNQFQRASQSRAGRRLVDGGGAQRVVSAMRSMSAVAGESGPELPLRRAG
jgi:UDP-2,4-diacetamido-2,4,6-trideoxy-beta-L-altropyranose hydrolase